jgi:chromosome segregation protein
MFVRSLRVAGFKSFADPTVLEFEPGINVIVGPNGSGKSNIADALQWVLGSQAPSSLRGASMEDVIFAGSEARPRLGMAEVELTLDNSSGVLPIDVAEATISRSTDRSGYSEYRINGAPCRLLDVTELLSDSGIGRSLHSLVGQGRLDAVLQAHPEERRGFIEEAAQIGKYRRRKERSLRKIERVDANLTRLADVLGEVRHVVRPLRRQASAAQAHSELMAEHRSLRQRLVAGELRRLEEEERALDLPGEQQRVALLEDELAHVRARLGGAGDERDAAAATSEQAARVLHRMGRAADLLASLVRIAGERAERLSARLAAETEEGYRERLRLLEGERSRFESSGAELRVDAAEAARRAGSAGERAAELRAEADRAEAALAAARARETEALQALVRAEGREAVGRATVDSMAARVKAVVERRDVAEVELGQDARAIAACEAEARALESRLDGATEAAAAAEAALEQKREEAERLRNALGSSHAQRAAAHARWEALAEARRAVEDVPGAPERLDPLIAGARGAAELASTGEERARHLVAAAEEATETSWQEVARRDEELRHLDALLAGAAARLEGARRRHEARAIELATLDDEAARAGEALAGAEREVAEERAQLPARGAQATEAARATEAAEATLAEARRAAEGARHRAAGAELEHRTAEERALAAELRLEEAEAGIADARGALAGIAETREGLEAARRRAEQVREIAALGAEVGGRWSAEADSRAAGARARARALDQALAGLRRRERDLERALEDISARRNRAEVRRAEMRARSEAVAERAMEEWALDVAAVLALEPLEQAEEEDARTRVARLEREIRRLGPINPQAAEEYAEAAEREAFLVGQTEDLKASRRDLLRIVREVDATIEAAFGTAYEGVAAEFEQVFARLFPGGHGRLALSDPGDLLVSGIEIEARPPGKNVRKLSLLSGGERSLVALALLFAIFRALPSPFYLLDEVDAALDDINLQRFLALAEELQETAQVMIVTHQRRTMEAADVLYGVSMARDGVSRVVAQRMDEVAV